MENGKFLISEFSPVWHHYGYMEKPSFQYKDDYNIKVPLEVSLDLERLIVESFVFDFCPFVTEEMESKCARRSMPFCVKQISLMSFSSSENISTK